MTSKRIGRIEKAKPTNSTKRGLVRLTTGFSPELVERLRKVAKHFGTDSSCHLQMALARYLDEVERDIEQLKDRK